MKKLALIVLLLAQASAFASPVVFSDDGKFGLKNESGNVIVEAKYKKLIRLGETAWIFQSGTRFGIMSDDGKILVEPKYSHADRVLGKFAKFGRGDKYGIFDEMGFEVLPVEYSSIDLLYGGMFLICKNYKYGITDFNGQIILDTIFDDIYMPKPNVMIIVYNGRQFEVQNATKEELSLPLDALSVKDDSDFVVKEIVENPVAATGYYSITATNYVLKLFSSISPAYEETIDELMFSQGADAASVIMKMGWLPRFPFVYAKRYYKNLTAPNNGPLSGVKTNLKREMSE